MFDEPPANLPMEPTAGPAPLPPLGTEPVVRPAASVPRPAPVPMPEPVAAAPIPRSSSKRQEPEDIFSDLEQDPMHADAAHATDAAGVSPHGRNLRRTALIIGGVVVAVAVLGAGGYFLYDRFIAAPAATLTPQPIVPDTDQNEGGFVPEETQEPIPEYPPTVPPTPPPEDIPPPTEVTPTEPADLDTDGDGLSDGREISVGSDVSVADSDADGLTDGSEVLEYQTNPTLSDSDVDGLTDGDEVRVWFTNPKNVDTDGDSFGDGMEVQNGFNPLGAGKLPESNP